MTKYDHFHPSIRLNTSIDLMQPATDNPFNDKLIVILFIFSADFSLSLSMQPATDNPFMIS